MGKHSKPRPEPKWGGIEGDGRKSEGRTVLSQTAAMAVNKPKVLTDEELREHGVG